MFKNQFQGGTGLELLSQQGSNPLEHWQVHRQTGAAYLQSPTTAAHQVHAAKKPTTSKSMSLVAADIGPEASKKQLKKFASPDLPLKRQYERDCKGFAYVLDGSTRLSFPKDERKGAHLVQPFLCFQLCLPEGHALHVDLSVNDSGNCRRRLLLSTSIKEIKMTPLHASVPLHFPAESDLHHLSLPTGNWTNLIIDMEALVKTAFKNQCQFRTLESISLCAPFCRLRKIFTLKDRPVIFPSARRDGDRDSITRSFQFPTGTDYTSILFDLSVIQDKTEQLRQSNHSRLCMEDSLSDDDEPPANVPIGPKKFAAHRIVPQKQSPEKIKPRAPSTKPLPVVTSKETKTISSNSAAKQKKEVAERKTASATPSQVPRKVTPAKTPVIPQKAQSLKPSKLPRGISVQNKPLKSRAVTTTSHYADDVTDEVDEEPPVMNVPTILEPPEPHSYPVSDTVVEMDDIRYNPSKYSKNATPELPSTTESVQEKFFLADKDEFPSGASISRLSLRKHSIAPIVDESVFDINDSDEENEELSKILRGSETLMTTANKLLEQLKLHTPSSSVEDLPSSIHTGTTQH